MPIPSYEVIEILRKANRESNEKLLADIRSKFRDVFGFKLDPNNSAHKKFIEDLKAYFDGVDSFSAGLYSEKRVTANFKGSTDVFTVDLAKLGSMNIEQTGAALLGASSISEAVAGARAAEEAITVYKDKLVNAVEAEAKRVLSTADPASLFMASGDDIVITARPQKLPIAANDPVFEMVNGEARIRPEKIRELTAAIAIAAEKVKTGAASSMRMVHLDNNYVGGKTRIGNEKRSDLAVKAELLSKEMAGILEAKTADDPVMKEKLRSVGMSVYFLPNEDGDAIGKLGKARLMLTGKIDPALQKLLFESFEEAARNRKVDQSGGPMVIGPDGAIIAMGTVPKRTILALPSGVSEEKKNPATPYIVKAAIQGVDKDAKDLELLKTPEERELYRLRIGSDGLIYDFDGKPFDTTQAVFTSTTGLRLNLGHAIFVMDAEGNIYASTRQVVGKFHHTSLAGGQPVASAGEIRVVDGKIEYLNDQSGHYRPEPQHSQQVLKQLANTLGEDKLKKSLGDSLPGLSNRVNRLGASMRAVDGLLAENGNYVDAQALAELRKSIKALDNKDHLAVLDSIIAREKKAGVFDPDEVVTKFKSALRLESMRVEAAVQTANRFLSKVPAPALPKTGDDTLAPTRRSSDLTMIPPEILRLNQSPDFEIEAALKYASGKGGASSSNAIYDYGSFTKLSPEVAALDNPHKMVDWLGLTELHKQVFQIKGAPFPQIADGRVGNTRAKTSGPWLTFNYPEGRADAGGINAKVYLSIPPELIKRDLRELLNIADQYQAASLKIPSTGAPFKWGDDNIYQMARPDRVVVHFGTPEAAAAFAKAMAEKYAKVHGDRVPFTHPMGTTPVSIGVDMGPSLSWREHVSKQIDESNTKAKYNPACAGGALVGCIKKELVSRGIDPDQWLPLNRREQILNQLNQPVSKLTKADYAQAKAKVDALYGKNHIIFGTPVAADLLAINQRLNQSAKSVLDAHASGQFTGEIPPFFDPKNPMAASAPTEFKGAKSWADYVENQRNTSPKFIVPPQNMVRMTGGLKAEVYSMTLPNGAKVVFRPVKQQTERAARLALAASTLNRSLGLDTVPEARLGVVNGTLGVISDYADGAQPGNYYDPKAVDPFSQADAGLFEFLVGNSDVHNNNFMVTNDGKIKVFDHDSSFPTTISPALANYTFGHHLPDQYSAATIEKLRAVSPEQLRQLLKDQLHPSEIDALIFRREMILRDADLRATARVQAKPKASAVATYVSYEVLPGSRIPARVVRTENGKIYVDHPDKVGKEIELNPAQAATVRASETSRAKYGASAPTQVAANVSPMRAVQDMDLAKSAKSARELYNKLAQEDVVPLPDRMKNVPKRADVKGSIDKKVQRNDEMARIHGLTLMGGPIYKVHDRSQRKFEMMLNDEWFRWPIPIGKEQKSHPYNYKAYLPLPADKIGELLPEILEEAKGLHSFKICGSPEECARKDRAVFYFTTPEELKAFAAKMDALLAKKKIQGDLPKNAGIYSAGRVGVGVDDRFKEESSHSFEVCKALFEASHSCPTKDAGCIQGVFDKYKIDPRTYMPHGLL